MKCESRITLEETPAFAAAATALIDDRLARLGEPARSAYWASVRKAYNTPYNDPAPGKRQTSRKLGNVAALGAVLTSAAEAAVGSAVSIVQGERVGDAHAA